MRNLTPGPKFSLLAATAILITLAVWPIGYAKAEKISLEGNQKDKRSLEEDDLSLKGKRSFKYKDVSFADQPVEHKANKAPLYYKKWEGGSDLSDEDLQYSPQSDVVGPDSAGADSNYESDGYGYDDDEYDHINYKRYDNDKDKLTENVQANKDANSVDKIAIVGDQKVNAPEATTIELLSFQAKNLNPGADSMQSKEESKVKSLSMKKPPYASKVEENEKGVMVNEKIKKKTSSEQKANELKQPGNDKNTGNVKAAESKMADSKSSLDNKGEKAKVSESGANAQIEVQNLKESVQVAESKENTPSMNDGKSAKFEDLSKNEAKITEKDVKGADIKFQSGGKEEKDATKIKEEKDLDVRISDAKAVAEGTKDDSRGKSLSQFAGSQTDVQSVDYKEGLDNMSDAGMTDDEKASEDVKDKGLNLAGLRDPRNELPYKYTEPGDRYRALKYLKKKAASEAYPRRKIGSRSNLAQNWKANLMGKEEGGPQGSFEHGPKEPFHLDFPLADLENTDYHRNFIKSLKRYKGLDESSRILGQGDTPSPYADGAKQQLASRVIEEEQRKRRSRLRRLKASPLYASVRKRDRGALEELYSYGPGARGRLQYGEGYGSPNLRYNALRGEGIYRNMQGYDSMGFIPAMANKRRGFSDDPFDESNLFEQLEDEDVTNNVKNKRQDTAGFYEDENEDSYAEKQFGDEGMPSTLSKRKSQGKSAWAGSDYSNSQKKKLKDGGSSYDEPSRQNTPLLLLQRTDNGQQAMKTFVDGTYKNEKEVDSDDLARILSRDSNYVVLKKVPGKEEAQKVSDLGLLGRALESDKGRTAIDELKRKDKYKGSQSELTERAHHSGGAEDSETRKSGVRGGSALKKEDRVKDLSDFFKSGNTELDEKKEILISIDNHLNQFQRGEPSKKAIYKPPLSQAYRHMKDFEGPDRLSDPEAEQRDYLSAGDKSGVGLTNPGFSGSDRVLKSFKKEGKEVVIMNRPFNGVEFKSKTQETVMQNSLAPNSNMAQSSSMGGSNVASSSQVQGSDAAASRSTAAQSNVAPASNAAPNANVASGSNAIPANTIVNGMNQNSMSHIKMSDGTQKAVDSNRRYYLYGNENDMGSSPKHEIKVIQSDFSLPSDSPYNALNYNPQNYNQQNYNKAGSPMKAANPTNKGSALASNQNEGGTTYAGEQSNGYDYSKSSEQQCTANGYQSAGDKRPSSVKEDHKRLSKKDSDELSGNLKRFMRDFKDFNTANNDKDDTYRAEDLSGMTLQELTSHGDKHLQKLNNLLKEIISNKVEVSNGESRQNVKRGMFQKQKSWQSVGSESQADPQVRSGKWTSVVYNGPSVSQLDYTDKSSHISPGESLFKEDAKLDAKKLSDKDSGASDKSNSARSTKEDTGGSHSKRSKRHVLYDSKDATKALEVKVKSTPYQVQPQPLFPSNTNTNANSNQQQKTSARAYMQLPPDKLLDLMNFFDSEHYDYRHLDWPKNRRATEEEKQVCQCARETPQTLDEEVDNLRTGRRLLSVDEAEEVVGEDGIDNKKTDCIRKSFESYLDPLVRKIAEYESKSGERHRRSSRKVKREIELDESMPNDFQNFLVTSLGGFGSQKREVVKKEEALWEPSDDSRDSSNQIVDEVGNREPDEDSALGKRDTSRNLKRHESYGRSESKDEKKSAVKESDERNIRIRIVDGNAHGGGDLVAKAAESGKGGGFGAAEETLKQGEGSGVASLRKGAEDRGRQNSASVHEVYLITSADAKRRKKKKYASPRSDQTTQKQPISNHLPQVETVYNPSPGSNKAQVEKINSNDEQMKLKCVAKPQSLYNASASMMEDNIIRNNLRTGNINTFTYQKKEEPTPYPLQSPTNPPTSSEFERLDSRGPPKPKMYHQLGGYEPYATSSFANNPEIIYKDENSQPYANMITNAKPMSTKQGYRSFHSPGVDLRRYNAGMKVSTYKSGSDGANPDPYQKDYAEEEPGYMEYSESSDESNSFANGNVNRQTADADWEAEDESEREASIRLIEENRRENERLNPKMVEMWNNYARTHLSPESHQEAMNREFQEAYLRSSLGGRTNMRFAGDMSRRYAENLQQQHGNEEMRANLLRNLNQRDQEQLLKRKPYEEGGQESRERLSVTQKRGDVPVQIGRRFFYTFKTEVPDEEYFAMFPEAVKFRGGFDKLGESKAEKKAEDVQFARQQQPEKIGQTVKRNEDDVLENVIGSYIVRKSASELDNHGENWKKMGVRQKREAEDASECGEQSKVTEKRLSSGHLTESHYKKYHQKILGGGRDAVEGQKERKIPVEEGGGCRVKRDSLTDTLKADMMRRMQEDKKARMMIKNLKLELTKSESPLIGPSLSPPEEPISVTSETQQQNLEEEKRKNLNKVAEDNAGQYKEGQQEQQHTSNAKSGSPDVYKTFEIKRGRRREAEGEVHTARKRMPPQGVRHTIVNRSNPALYQDLVFLKDSKVRKARTFSDEGFEPITPDLRFSEKSYANYHGSKAGGEGEGPYKVSIGEGSSATVSRRADDKGKAGKEAAVKQKFTHGVSHEAPLLTPPNPLNSPKIFDAIKQASMSSSHGKLLDRQANAASVLASLQALARAENARNTQGTHRELKENKESENSEPFLGAVLVLTKRNKSKREAPSEDESEDTRPNADWAPSEEGREFNEELPYQEEAPPEVGKRSAAELLQGELAADGASDLTKSDQTAEIVNEDGGCRSRGGESDTKTCNLKKTDNFKQPSFPFSQSHNINVEARTGDESEMGDSGEYILESILGRVESNPQFRKVIGPGLKWRGRKCYAAGEGHHRCICPPSNRGTFVRQVRKILAKFVRDIEKLAEQDMTRSSCCKLDCRSNRFLHELLKVPYEPREDPEGQCKTHLEPILRDRCMSGSETSTESSSKSPPDDSSSVEAMEKRRKLVLKLLEEYRNLSDYDKKSVEVLGQYLMHELDKLDNLLGIKGETVKCSSETPEVTTAAISKASDESSGSSTVSQGSEATTANMTFTSECPPTSEKDMKRASVKLPFIWSNPEDIKYIKPGWGSESGCPPTNMGMPSATEVAPFTLPRTENILLDNPIESSGVLTSDMMTMSKFDFFTGDPQTRYPNPNPADKFNLKLPELHKLGYGDAAGLQLSLKSHAPWVSNLNLGKSKPIDLWQLPKRPVELPVDLPVRAGVTDVPYFPEESLRRSQMASRRDAEDADNVYDFEYQEYDDDDDDDDYYVYQVPKFRGRMRAG